MTSGDSKGFRVHRSRSPTYVSPEKASTKRNCQEDGQTVLLAFAYWSLDLLLRQPGSVPEVENGYDEHAQDDDSGHDTPLADRAYHEQLEPGEIG